MQHGLFTYPWELADQGYDRALGEIAQAGFAHVNLAMQYHNGKFLLPRNPKRRVAYAEDGAISFRHDPARYGRLQPRRHSLVTDTTSPAEEVSRRAEEYGVQMVAWVVCLHNRWLGEQLPEATQHTAFGDPLLNSLSPAHPLVREYLVALISDMVAQHDLRAVMMESPGYMPFVHGEHHELIGIALDAAQLELLQLSFSEYEIAQAEADGIPARALRELTAAALDASLNQGLALTNADGSPSGMLSRLQQHGLPAYAAWLKQQELSLVSAVRNAVHAINPTTGIWHFAALDGTPGDAALVASGDVTLAGYAQSDADAGHRVQAAAALGRPVRGAIRAIAPDTVDPAIIAPRRAAWEDAGVTGIDVYNYGLMNGVIWDAVRTAFAR